ncbi:MAG: nitroreductase [Pseudonocardiales bacterium]|nr:MAG: nitroreductase [Pseudonocardiales bacterium]
MRMRRAYSLICFWQDGALAVYNYLFQTVTALDPVAVEVLDAFGEWTDPVDIGKRLVGYTPESVQAAVDVLGEHTLLLAQGSAEARVDEQLAEHWQMWAPEAALLHFGTKNVPFEETTPQLREELMADGRPALFKEYPHAERILLPRHPIRLDTPLEDVLHRRRTHRAFTGQPVPLAVLSTLVHTVFAPVGYLDAGAFGALARRTSPAGGARQELEAYVAAFDVEGVDRGLYHYNSREHSLELLRSDLTAAQVAQIGVEQAALKQCAFAVFLTAVIERASVKYRHPRAYRVILMNAGHLGQTFALTATALGLGPFQTAAFHDSTVEDLLGIDGITEIPVYLLAAGIPASDSLSPAATLNAFRRTTL